MIRIVEKLYQITIKGKLYDIKLPYGKNLTLGNKRHLRNQVNELGGNIRDIEMFAFNNISIKLKETE